MITYKQAKTIIRNFVAPSSGYEEISVLASNQRILKIGIKAKISNPRFDQSAMDGAVIYESDNNKKTLKLVGESKAGDLTSHDFKKGEAKLIFTGAPVAGKKKKIIPKEDFIIDEKEKKIVILKPNNYDFIRKEGSDFKKGHECILKDSVMHPRSIALAKSMKVNKIKVKSKPKISVIITGDELISKNNKFGIIESSNEILIKSIINKFGGNILEIHNVRDNIKDFQKIYDSLSNFDLLITSGGISRGKYDIVKNVLVGNGLEILFDRVKIKPGKPSTFGKLKNNKFFLGLPGNPVSCFISMIIFFSVYINSFFGIDYINFYTRQMQCNSNVKKNNSLTTFLRIKTNKDRKKSFSVFDYQDSSLQKILNDSDGLIIRKPFEKEIKVGDFVDVLLYRDILNSEI